MAAGQRLCNPHGPPALPQPFVWPSGPLAFAHKHTSSHLDTCELFTCRPCPSRSNHCHWHSPFAVLRCMALLRPAAVTHCALARPFARRPSACPGSIFVLSRISAVYWLPFLPSKHNSPPNPLLNGTPVESLPTGLEAFHRKKHNFWLCLHAVLLDCSQE